MVLYALSPFSVAFYHHIHIIFEGLLHKLMFYLVYTYCGMEGFHILYFYICIQYNLPIVMISIPTTYAPSHSDFPPPLPFYVLSAVPFSLSYFVLWLFVCFFPYLPQIREKCDNCLWGKDILYLNLWSPVPSTFK
jgi:hypothetical protein